MARTVAYVIVDALEELGVQQERLADPAREHRWNRSRPVCPSSARNSTIPTSPRSPRPSA
ncbi:MULTISPECIES: hypothetical protein [unclassified Streptomyces]|uniref:hypothetical protein n=1 Tax=unclassified Streptomyces TaxID=2593676 RepID=UPI00341C0C80